MMEYVIRVKHFDVSIINGTENMTSVDCITRLGNEFEVNRKKGNPHLKEEPKQKKNCQPEKQFTKTSSKLISLFRDHLKLFASFTV